jgi:hypothetical protein
MGERNSDEGGHDGGPWRDSVGRKRGGNRGIVPAVVEGEEQEKDGGESEQRTVEDEGLCITVEGNSGSCAETGGGAWKKDA